MDTLAKIANLGRAAPRCRTPGSSDDAGLPAQRIAAEAAGMQDRGVRVAAIARHFGVDYHTADKAIGWFRGR